MLAPQAALGGEPVLPLLRALPVALPHHRMRFEPAFEVAAPEHFLDELLRRRAMMPLGVLHHFRFQDEPVAEPRGKQARTLGVLWAEIGVAGAGVLPAQGLGEALQAGKAGFARRGERS